jgi:hypothetical protein
MSPFSLAVATMKLNRLEKTVEQALSNLDNVKQEIIKRRFGLVGEPSMSYEDIARYLSSTLAPEVRLQIATKVGESDEAGLCADDVKQLESEGLRELAKRGKRSKPLP